jgi:hypothetical protein
MPKPNNPPGTDLNSPDKGTGVNGGAGFSLESIEDEELREFAQRKFGSSIEQMSPAEIALKALEMQHNQEKLHSKQENELGNLRKQINEIASGRTSPEPGDKTPPNKAEEGLPVEYLENLDTRLTKLDELSEQLANLPATTKEIGALKQQMESMLSTMKNSMDRVSRFDSLAAMRERKIVAEMIEEDFNLIKREFAKDKDGDQKAIALMGKILPYLNDDPGKNPLGEKTKSFIDIVWSREHPVLAARNFLFPDEAKQVPSPSEGGGKSSIPGEEPSKPAETTYLEHLVNLTNRDFTENIKE